MSSIERSLGSAGASWTPTAASGTSESTACSDPCEPPPRWLAPPASRNSKPRAAEATTSPAFTQPRICQRRASAFGYVAETSVPLPSSSRVARSPSTVHAFPRASRSGPPGANRSSRPAWRTTACPSSRQAATSTEGRASRRSAISCERHPAREPVDVACPVRRGDGQVARARVGAAAPAKQTHVGEGVADVVVLVDRRLAVIRAQHDGVALEERLDAPGCRHERGDGIVRARDGRGSQGIAAPMPGRVGLGQVEQQEVEAVARHEPASHCRGVRVVATADAEARRSARALGREQLAEVELARPVGRVHEAGAPREAREHRVLERVAHPPAPDREVDRCGDHARVLYQLEQRPQLGREMDVVEVHDRVVDRLLGALDERRLERGSVLDEPLLAAVVPLQRRDPRPVGSGAGRDRREADGRERRERRDGLPEAAALDEHAQVRRGTARDGGCEGVRREAVDDDQDQLARRHEAAA